MSKIRDFFTGLPLACGVDPELAKIYGDHLGRLYDYELANPAGVFSRDNFGSVAKRLSYAFQGWRDFADSKAVAYGLRLAIYLAKVCGENKGIMFDDKSFQKEILLADEGDNPKVAALMTVEQATVQTVWT